VTHNVNRATRWTLPVKRAKLQTRLQLRQRVMLTATVDARRLVLVNVTEFVLSTLVQLGREHAEDVLRIVWEDALCMGLDLVMCVSRAMD